jgi:aspartyl/glutamyl-tRNA(Asn/Gln) amidotransferase C subunit
MSNFTKEKIDKYANDLLIGLTEEERTMIQEEFDTIEHNMDLINKIPNIKDVEPQSFPFEMEMDDLRDDSIVGEEIDIDTLLRNCDQFEGREVEVPKVVG